MIQWNVHKNLTKKCPKLLDFCPGDEYNTLSTQRNGVLKNRTTCKEAPGVLNCFHYILL
nr:MAG TPA: hypothetical protein [Caudoviricetes sp.]